MLRAVFVGILTLALGAGLAGAADYDRQQAGHPLRIAAYALHPAGVILDRLIFEPAWKLGQREPWRTLFGVKTLPPALENDPEAEPLESSP